MSAFFPFWLAAYRSPSKLSRVLAVVLAVFVMVNAAALTAAIL